MKKFAKNHKVLVKEFNVAHMVSSSCLLVLDLISSFISLLHSPIKRCILNMLTTCHNVITASMNLTEEDNCPKEKYFLEAACSTKANGVIDYEEATEEYEDDFLAGYKQDPLEKAKSLKKEEDTSYYFSSSATLDYSDDNFSEYDSGEEDDSLPITTDVDKSQLRDNDSNLSGDAML